MLNRRRLIVAGGSLTVAGLAGVNPRLGAQGNAVGLPQALVKSELVYLSPLRSDGTLSQCQAEVWFAYVDDAIYVVTASDAWRARAVTQGLGQTQVWVGDVGQWRSSREAYLQLPRLKAQADFVREQSAQSRVLAAMGGKYSAEWGVWGPRFRNGLADGSRVMLRYRPV